MSVNFSAENQKNDKKQPRIQLIAKEPTPYELTPIDLEYLEAAYRLRFVTLEQFLRWRNLSLGGIEKHRKRIKLLCGLDIENPCPAYLDRNYQPRYEPHGSLPLIYSLGDPGKKKLKELGYDVSVYVKKRRIERLDPKQLPHHLAVNEVLLAGRDLHRHEPRVRLESFLHDFMLRFHPDWFKVTIYKSDKELCPSFCPDAQMDFLIERSPGEQPVAKRFFLEVDMDTHERHEFKKKIASYIEFFSSGTYTKHFGNVRNVVVLFLSPKGDRRRDEMRLWTREQFEQPLYSPCLYINGKAPGEADYKRFLFASVPPGPLHPLETFLQPICYYPYANADAMSAIRLSQLPPAMSW